MSSPLIAATPGTYPLTIRSRTFDMSGVTGGTAYVERPRDAQVIPYSFTVTDAEARKVEGTIVILSEDDLPLGGMARVRVHLTPIDRWTRWTPARVED